LRGGVGRVLIPKDNEKDLADIPNEVKQQLAIHPVQWIDQVFELALTVSPRSLPAAVGSTDPAAVGAESYLAH